MTTQLATQAPGQPMGHTSYVPRDAYIYDISHRAGLAMPTIALQDLEALTMPITDMGEALVCPVATGACVSSTTGGDVIGYDMYGQYIMETVEAAGISTIAFASVVAAPEDAAWANQFGLPYMYDDAAPTPNADVLIAVPTDTEDARGTFSYGGDLTDPVEVEVPFMVNRATPFGEPYAPRFASPAFDTQTLAITGTVDGDGLVTVTIPSTGGAEVPCEVKYPDGFSQYASSGTAPTYTLDAVWMSQYGRQIVDDPVALGNLVTVDPLGNEYAPVYVQLTGSALPTVVHDTPPSPAPPTVDAPPTSFSNHAAADAWLAQYITATGHDEPDDWSGQTLGEKRASAQALFEHWEADH